MFLENLIDPDIWIPEVDTPCKENPDVWSDSSVYRKDPDAAETAMYLCRMDCPVVMECLVAALEEEKNAKTSSERIGIRGGMRPFARHKMWNSR